MLACIPSARESSCEHDDSVFQQVGLGHSVTRAVVDSYHGETRASEHTGISPAEEGWTVANDNETLVAALTCNVHQHGQLQSHSHMQQE
jgi:hypothetical protein